MFIFLLVMKKLFFGLLVGAFLGLVSPYVLADSALVGSSWNLVSYDGTGASGTLEITDTTLFSQFCNNVSQGFVFSGATIVASGAGMSTLMYCEWLPMTLETAFSFQQPATYLLSGTVLTITTHEQHVFVFEKELPTVCTLEYMPVCGYIPVKCTEEEWTQACPMYLPQTYGNKCQLAAEQATYLYDGICVTDEACIQLFDGCNTCMKVPDGERACTKMACETYTTPSCLTISDDIPLVGGDEDAHGCKWSAGYSRSQSQLACVRVWENTWATALQTAYDFAFNNGMTTMETMTTFRADDMITRQEAAKMLVAYAESSFGKSLDTLSGACTITYTDEATFDPTLKLSVYNACAYQMMKWSQGKFFPNDTLTKGQALAILMRTVDGWLTEEDTATWWMPYVTRATERKFITFDTLDAFNDPISRGDLIKLAHTIFLASVNQ